jgi:transposase
MSRAVGPPSPPSITSAAPVTYLDALYRIPVIPRCGRVDEQAYHVWGWSMPAYFFRGEPGAAELRRLARRESGRVCQRVLMIANLLEGMEHEEAARLAGLSRSAAYDWHNRYEEGGIEGLRDRPRRGRQPRVDAVTSARFKERMVAGAVLERDGVVAFRGVDAQRILKEEFEIDCSLSSTYRLLHRIKLSWLAPRPRHPEADATAQAAFSQHLDCN